MKRQLRNILLAGLLCCPVLSCGEKTQPVTPATPPDPIPDNVTDKTPGTDMFYKGTTMCFASYLQDAGLVYREEGKVCDPYASVKTHGGNCIRLQLDRSAFGKKGERPIDWQGWDRVLADAKKAKSRGLEIFLTLKPDYDIYSSGATIHNNLPVDWSGKTEPEVGTALYDWVYGTLVKLADEGVYPAIVAVGNEVNIGFLNPRTGTPADNARTGRLLAYAHKAVREYALRHNPACLSAVHIADPSKCEYCIKACEAAGATDYDIVALSYYPGKKIGHKLPYDSFSTLAKCFPKRKIMVVETAYSFTDGTVDGKWMGDHCDNAYDYPDWNEDENGRNYTPQQGRAWLAALAADIREGGGLGLITWGSESLPDLQEGEETGHGLGIYTYPADWAYGSTWENNSYWDFTDGNNLHGGIDWMKDIQ